MAFLGNSTWTFRKQGDKNSGPYCTIPVKLSFKDRNTRVNVEQTLRSRCKVTCSTPYPPILRDCIKQVLESGKAARPDNFSRVTVDLKNLSLKLSWRERPGEEWQNYARMIRIPKEAFDIRAKKCEGFKVENLPLPKPKPPNSSPNGARSPVIP
jgi:hypothetical protein